MMNKVKIFLSYPILLFFWLIIKKSKKWDLIHADIQYYLHDYSDRMANVRYRDFVHLMIIERTFRNVLYYRLKRYWKHRRLFVNCL